MKLVLAGLALVTGMLLLVQGMDALGLVEGGPTPLTASLFVVLMAAMFWLVFRLLGGREHEERQRDQVLSMVRDDEAGEPFEPRASFDHRFSFLSTHGDLLRAHRAVRGDSTGMRGWVRGLVILMGLAWTGGFAATLGDGATPARWVWLVLGTAVLWFAVVSPFRARRAIVAGNAPEQTVALRFTSRRIESLTEGVGAGHWWWRDVFQFLPTEGGLAFTFTDGSVCWLPARVFPSDAAREHFVAEVEERLAREAARFLREPADHPIVAEPWSYRVEDFHHGEGEGGSFVDLVLRRGDDVRRLRFLDATEVDYRADLGARASSGMAILSVPHPELDGVGVRVTDRDEEGSALYLWAADVVDLDASVDQLSA